MKLRGLRIQKLDNQVATGPSLLPRPEFSMLVSASKGCGKSSLLINMLINPDLLAGKFNQIHIISPTNRLDEKWNILRQSKVLTPNFKLLKEYQNTNRVSIVDYGTNQNPEYNLELTNNNFTEEVSIELIKGIIAEQKMVIEKFGKSYADRVLMLFDDTASNKKFWNSQAVQQLMFNSRHYKVSLIITTQAFHSIPKSLRLNMSMLIVYYTANATELKSIYEENSSNLNFNQFKRMFDYVCNDRPFNFLTINYQNSQEYRYSYCFEKFIETT
jgi:hypothetical protein